jgi:hypothetical protein
MLRFTSKLVTTSSLLVHILEGQKTSRPLAITGTEDLCWVLLKKTRHMRILQAEGMILRAFHTRLLASDEELASRVLLAQGSSGMKRFLGNTPERNQLRYEAGFYSIVPVIQ